MKLRIGTVYRLKTTGENCIVCGFMSDKPAHCDLVEVKRAKLIAAGNWEHIIESRYDYELESVDASIHREFNEGVARNELMSKYLKAKKAGGNSDVGEEEDFVPNAIN